MTAPAYGFYGKVPCLGDFVRRGLSQAFVEDWDAWMQELLVIAQVTMEDRWQDCYMSAPIWRFTLAAGLCRAGPQRA